MTKGTEHLESQKRQERETLVRLLRAWYGSLKSLKLYTAKHPSSVEAFKQFAAALDDVFGQRIELTVQHTDGVFMVDDFLFLEESLLYFDLLKGIEDNRMSQVVFLPGATVQELTDFCVTLLEKPGPEGKGYASDHVQALTVTTAEDQKRDKDVRLKGGTMVMRAAQLHEEWVALANAWLAKLLEEQNIPVGEVALALDRLIDLMQQSPQSMAVVVSLKPAVNLSSHHAVNTTILSMFIGQQLGYDATTLKMLSIAALVHDIGRHLLPSDFAGDYRLAAGDADFVRLHARDGASFLAGVPGLPMSVVRAALEHHIGHDNLGYPSLPGAQQIHPFSEIVALADFASWRTLSESHYNKPAPMHRVVRSMLRRMGSQFDPALVKLLVPFFGLYPPGTRVRLSTREEAVVIEPNIRNILRPSVACRGADGRFAFRWLGEMNQATGAFACSIERVLGIENDFVPLLDLLPEIGEKAA